MGYHSITQEEYVERIETMRGKDHKFQFGAIDSEVLGDIQKATARKHYMNELKKEIWVRDGSL